VTGISAALADVKTLVPVMNALKQGFRIRKVVVVSVGGKRCAANARTREWTLPA